MKTKGKIGIRLLFYFGGLIIIACADGFCPSIVDLKCPSAADNVVHIVA